MTLSRALIFNFIAGGGSKVSVILIRLVQVPLLLSLLGVDEYGRWLVLTSLPSWLSLANLGFGSVASNEVSLNVARGDIARARSVFSTTIALLCAIAIPGLAISGIVVLSFPCERFLGLTAPRHDEIRNALFLLAATVFVSFFYEAFAGRFRAARKAHIAVACAASRPWIDLLLVVIAMQFSHRFDVLAFAALAAALFFLVVIQFVSYRSMRQLTWSWSAVRVQEFAGLFRKGAAFQAFPLGNALLFQGSILIVQAIVGPAAVVLFATARTLVRTVNQAMDVVNQSIWPELSHLMGSGELHKAARLHRMGVVMSMALAATALVALLLFGQSLYHLWTGSALSLPKSLFILFLVAIPFNALWFASSVVHVASNQHEGLAARYLLASLVTAVACLGLTNLYGVQGAAASTVVTDLILIPYVVRRSLQLTGETWSSFRLGLVRDIHLTAAMTWRRVSQAGSN
jgi:O-antigen/teichoic acid export membrane protein